MHISSNILIPEERIEERVAAMPDAIAADTPDGTELSVIALKDGAFMFCADLVRRLPMPVYLAMTPVLSVDRGGDPGRITLPLDFPVEGADVLIVEDILLPLSRRHLLPLQFLVQRPRQTAEFVLQEYFGAL